MSEFTQGMLNTLKSLIGSSSLGLSIIFFIGHVIIAMAVVSLITGASIWEAGAVALVEPAINSVWFYVLHKVYTLVKDS
tara:strand:- start:12710 stop:12946 length:237 start_codon:yes stop_codon:yes gene_type:complete